MHHIGKEFSPEEFIAEHTLLYVIEGVMNVYDGSKKVTLKAGDCCLGRRNRLARYNKEKTDKGIEKVFIFFDELFLRQFQERYHPMVTKFISDETLIEIKGNKLLPGYIDSLLPFYHRLIIREPFSVVKREELLLILLEAQPELAGLLFDFTVPQKINLEAFMNRNFKFNISIERFAYLTGRSLSAFKRDFKEIFGQSPSRWLVQKRLQEAYFLIEKKQQKPNDIYIDLGFETIQHFSFAFKKKFGYTPSGLLVKKD